MLPRQAGKPMLDPSNLKAAAQGAVNDGRSAASDAAAHSQGSSGDQSAFFSRLNLKAQPEMDVADKDALVNIMVRTGKSRRDAKRVADNYEQTYNQGVAKYEALEQQAEQKVRLAGDAAATGVSHVAWTGVIVLLLGAIVLGMACFLESRSNPDLEEILV